ncbi:uncharacterized protein LOC142343152 isoform X2 [Convolutriloba macropyga]|uniref:uncharacterized protein LOC142343152 isoform X2 n=1 Tax=Convolutriloba macropyga TaxID=536237 RepID=UPI003F52536B
MDKSMINGKGDRMTSYQQKLPKIPISGKSSFNDVPETPSPNTYSLNVQRQKSTFATPLATNQEDVPKSSSVSIKPPPKKQKIDMSSFESAPKLERTNSGSVLTTLEGPILKVENQNSIGINSRTPNLVVSSNQGVVVPFSSVSSSLQNSAELPVSVGVSIASVNDLVATGQVQSNIALVEDRSRRPAQLQIKPSNNPFDVAFKSMNEKSLESQDNQRVVPSLSTLQAHEHVGATSSIALTAPLTPLKTSDIPDIVQDLQDTLQQQTQNGQAVAAQLLVGTAQPQQQVAQFANINGVTYLVATAGNQHASSSSAVASHTLKDSSSNQPQLLVSSPNIASLIAASPQSNNLVQLPSTSTSAQKSVPHRLLTLRSVENGQQQLVLVPGTAGSAAASLQDVQELLTQPQISVTPMINTLGQNIGQSLVNLRAPPTVTTTSGNSAVPTLSAAPSLLAVSNNIPLSDSNVNAKAKMREQLEKKMISSGNANPQLQLQMNSSSALLKENNSSAPLVNGGVSGSGGIPGTLNTVNSGMNGNSSGNGFNSMVDSTTKVGEGDPKYSLTREKNREAAQRCREKRKKWITSIQDENKRLNTENARLKEQVAVLQHELMDLKTRLLNEHSLLSNSVNKLSLPSSATRSGIILDVPVNLGPASSTGGIETAAGGGTIVQQPPPKPDLPFSDLILSGKEYKLNGQPLSGNTGGVDVAFIKSNYIKGGQQPVDQVTLATSVGDQTSQDSNDSRTSVRNIDRVDSGIESDAESANKPVIHSIQSVASMGSHLKNEVTPPKVVPKYIHVYQRPPQVSSANGRPASTPLMTFDDSYGHTSQLITSDGGVSTVSSLNSHK